jgi:hypothetical protein
MTVPVNFDRGAARSVIFGLLLWKSSSWLKVIKRHFVRGAFSIYTAVVPALYAVLSPLYRVLLPLYAVLSPFIYVVLSQLSAVVRKLYAVLLTLYAMLLLNIISIFFPSI